ncbi:hypothetical protein Aperf_G00000046091 [Anoplocephala perfoliata]
MKLSGCFHSALNATSICIILCFFFVPRGIRACRPRNQSEASTTPQPNLNVSVLNKDAQRTHFSFDEDFRSNGVALENYMLNKKRAHCLCGPILFQRKFCSSDFVIVAKKVSEPKRFGYDFDWIEFNYEGLVVPMLVQRVLRGSVEPNKVMSVHFVRGSYCGGPPEAIPVGDKSYIVAEESSKSNCQVKPVSKKDAYAVDTDRLQMTNFDPNPMSKSEDLSPAYDIEVGVD